MQRLTSADKGRTDARLHLDTVRTLKQGYSRCTSLPHSTSYLSISAPEAVAESLCTAHGTLCICTCQAAVFGPGKKRKRKKLVYSLLIGEIKGVKIDM